jgi:hypothetical protein
MWTDMSPCDLHVFNVRKKILSGCRLKRWRRQCHSLAFVPVTAEGKFFVEEIHWLVYQWDACFSAHKDYFRQPLYLCTEKSPNAFHLNSPDMLSAWIYIYIWIIFVIWHALLHKHTQASLLYVCIYLCCMSWDTFRINRLQGVNCEILEFLNGRSSIAPSASHHNGG